MTAIGGVFAKDNALRLKKCCTIEKNTSVRLPFGKKNLQIAHCVRTAYYAMNGRCGRKKKKNLGFRLIILGR